MEQIDNVDVETTETDTEVEAESEAPAQKETKPERAPETPEAKVARLRRQLDREEKKLGIAPEKEVEQQKPDKTGELDLSQLAYLRATIGLKGQAEIALAREYIKAGKDVLDLENNRHFMNDLKDLRDGAETKAATPTSTRRSNTGGGDDVEIAYAKWKETGKLPDDFKLRAAVVNREVDTNNAKLPPWKRK